MANPTLLTRVIMLWAILLSSIVVRSHGLRVVEVDQPRQGQNRPGTHVSDTEDGGKERRSYVSNKPSDRETNKVRHESKVLRTQGARRLQLGRKRGSLDPPLEDTANGEGDTWEVSGEERKQDEGSNYGTYGTYMGGGSDGGGGASTSPYETNGATSGMASASAAGAGSYASGTGSYNSEMSSYGSGGASSNGDDNYGSTSSYNSGTTGSYGSGSSTSSYGSGTYGGGSASSYGSDTYGSGSSSYGSGSYSSTWGAGAASSSGTSWGGWKSSSSSPWGNTSELRTPSTINIFLGVIVMLSTTLCGMLVTAHRMEHDPEGNFANCCRLSLNTVSCVHKVIYNLYHCRLGDVLQVVFASELDEDEYTDEEIERMTLRPGIERALDVEHRKALRKVGIEMNKIKVKPTTNNGQQGKQ